jgi:hypothetical protein
VSPAEHLCRGERDASREFSGPGRALNLVFAALDVAVV